MTAAASMESVTSHAIFKISTIDKPRIHFIYLFRDNGVSTLPKKKKQQQNTSG